MFWPSPGGRYLLNFKDGEEIVDPDLVATQTRIHHHWKEVQADYNAAGGWRDSEPLTVARAILLVDSAG